MDDTLIIDARFNGPRLSGNGGYVGGVMAGRFTETFGGDGAVEITLRAPIPIDSRLQVVRDGDALMLRDGDALICEARRIGGASKTAARTDRLGRRHAPCRDRRLARGHRLRLVRGVRSQAWRRRWPARLRHVRTAAGLFAVLL